MTQTPSSVARTPGTGINAAAVLIGGAAGALCRFGGNIAIMDMIRGPFPLGILVINVAGGFLMGLLQGAIKRSGSPHTLLYNLLGTGFLGGFTTFSTFSLESLTLLERGKWLLGGSYMLLSMALCLLGAALGQRLSRL